MRKFDVRLNLESPTERLVVLLVRSAVPLRGQNLLKGLIHSLRMSVLAQHWSYLAFDLCSTNTC